jgi:hypothetical protein
MRSGSLIHPVWLLVDHSVAPRDLASGSRLVNRWITVAIRGIKSTGRSHISAMIAVHSPLILPDIKNSPGTGTR